MRFFIISDDSFLCSHKPAITRFLHTPTSSTTTATFPVHPRVNILALFLLFALFTSRSMPLIVAYSFTFHTILQFNVNMKLPLRLNLRPKLKDKDLPSPLWGNGEKCALSAETEQDTAEGCRNKTGKD